MDCSMDYSNEIPKNCSIIRNNRLTLLIRDDFKERLLKQGILDPQSLISNASKNGTFYKGRGLLPALLINGSEGERMVAKQSLRGGLLRFLNKDLFLNGNRPFKEMTANAYILSKGIKTTEILAAAKLKVLGPLYRTFIFSKEISEAIDLTGLFNSLKKKTPQERLTIKKKIFRALARSIYTMHNQGIYHSDLHLKNILICQNDVSAEPDVYIIDFDKALLKGRLSTRKKIDNLLRFNRSLEKYKFQWGVLTRTDQIRLLKEYIKYDSQVSDIIEIYLRRYLRFLKLRKVKWKILGSVMHAPS
jgi:tRNA A-37 threonylcarbamoyl transferase component Bud32